MNRPGAIVTVLSLGAIAAVTLWPFTFDPRWLTWSEYVAAFGLPPRSMLDFPRNVVLFMPLGVGVVTLFDPRGRARWTAVLLACAAGLAASACVESLQIFLPRRTPTVADVVGNALGAMAGAVAWHWWQRRGAALSASTGRRPAPQMRAVAFGVYLLLMLVVVWGLMWGVRPQRWDAAYSVTPGNLLTHQDPWRGTVSDLLVLDRAVDAAGAGRLLAGGIPPVPSAAVEEQSAFTAKAAEDDLADRVNRTGQFTVAFTVATFDLRQEDPSPILRSIADLRAGNLWLGQDEAHLVLSWRSPLTLANDLDPQLEFPGVFTSVAPQRLVVSFDGSLARLWTAGGETDILLGPEAVFSAMLRETNFWPVRPGRSTWWASAAPLSAVMFLPLGVLLSPALRMARRRGSRAALMLGGLCVPALLVEGFVAAYRNGDLRPDILVFGIAVTCLGFVVCRVCAEWLSKQLSVGPESLGWLCCRHPSASLER